MFCLLISVGDLSPTYLSFPELCGLSVPCSVAAVFWPRSHINSEWDKSVNALKTLKIILETFCCHYWLTGGMSCHQGGNCIFWVSWGIGTYVAWVGVAARATPTPAVYSLANIPMWPSGARCHQVSLTAFNVNQLEKAVQVVSWISKDLRSKGAEDTDKDTAEEIGYWKKLTDPPVILTLFIICLVQGTRSRDWALFFPGSSISHGSLEKQQINCNHALHAKGEWTALSRETA